MNHPNDQDLAELQERFGNSVRRRKTGTKRAALPYSFGHIAYTASSCRAYYNRNTADLH